MDEAFLNQIRKNVAAIKFDLFLTGTCEAGSDATTIVDLSYAGYGADYFNNRWYAQCIQNANSVGAAPEGEIRQITDYVTATGTFTVDTFSAALQTGDKIAIMHRNIAGTKYQEYLTGSGNWPKPLGVDFIDFVIVAGGGGGCNSGTYGGGGGGEVVIRRKYPVSAKALIAYVVGAGGAAGANGAASSFDGITAEGGFGIGASAGEPGGGAGFGNATDIAHSALLGYGIPIEGATRHEHFGGLGGAVGLSGGQGRTQGGIFGMRCGGGGGGHGTDPGTRGGQSAFANGGASGGAGVGYGGGGASWGPGGVGNAAAGANTGGGGGGNKAGGSGYILIMWD